MRQRTTIGLPDVQAVYSGPEGRLWELLMGEQIHVGGLDSSLKLAERAGIQPGSRGVDLCCCSGAGMRFLTRFREVAAMHGIDATQAMIDLGQQRCREEGCEDRIHFSCAEATNTGLDSDAFDFVWGEDAWCYVADKPALIAEAVRLTRPGGTIAFTDWCEGPVKLSDDDAQRFMAFMKFPSLATADEYRQLLEDAGCDVIEAEDTGIFPEHIDLYIAMVEKQLTYDAFKLVGFDPEILGQIANEMGFTQKLVHEGPIIQGRFVARKRETQP